MGAGGQREAWEGREAQENKHQVVKAGLEASTAPVVGSYRRFDPLHTTPYITMLPGEVGAGREAIPGRWRKASVTPREARTSFPDAACAGGVRVAQRHGDTHCYGTAGSKKDPPGCIHAPLSAQAREQQQQQDTGCSEGDRGAVCLADVLGWAPRVADRVAVGRARMAETTAVIGGITHNPGAALRPMWALLQRQADAFKDAAIVVYENDSTDGTPAVLAELCAAEPRAVCKSAVLRRPAAGHLGPDHPYRFEALAEYVATPARCSRVAAPVAQAES